MMRRPNKAWQGLIKSIAPRVGLALGGAICRSSNANTGKHTIPRSIWREAVCKSHKASLWSDNG